MVFNIYDVLCDGDRNIVEAPIGPDGRVNIRGLSFVLQKPTGVPVEHETKILMTKERHLGTEGGEPLNVAGKTLPYKRAKLEMQYDPKLAAGPNINSERQSQRAMLKKKIGMI